MANEPLLFAVDHEREVLRAVERDLRKNASRIWACRASTPTGTS